MRDSERGTLDDNFHDKNIMGAQHKTTNASKKHNFTSLGVKFLDGKSLLCKRGIISISQRCGKD